MIPHSRSKPTIALLKAGGPQSSTTISDRACASRSHSIVYERRGVNPKIGRLHTPCELSAVRATQKCDRATRGPRHQRRQAAQTRQSRLTRHARSAPVLHPRTQSKRALRQASRDPSSRSRIADTPTRICARSIIKTADIEFAAALTVVGSSALSASTRIACKKENGTPSARAHQMTRPTLGNVHDATNETPSHAPGTWE
jgi:hypothetical protein